jgi:hypothetical protein
MFANDMGVDRIKIDASKGLLYTTLHKRFETFNATP